MSKVHLPPGIDSYFREIEVGGHIAILDHLAASAMPMNQMNSGTDALAVSRVLRGRCYDRRLKMAVRHRCSELTSTGGYTTIIGCAGVGIFPSPDIIFGLSAKPI